MVKSCIKRWAVRFFQTLFSLGCETIKDDFPVQAAMVIAPHPDDETLACGALIARLRERGVRVRLVVVTDGSASTASAQVRPWQLAKIRQSETQKAARFLGVGETDIVFLSYPDGQAAVNIEKIQQDLAAQIWLCSPEWLLVPYAEDGHADHRAVAEAISALRAAHKITGRVLSYPLWFWPRGAFALLRRPSLWRQRRKIRTRGFLECKAQAMQAYHSQRENLSGETEWSVLDDSFWQQNLCAYEWFMETDNKP